MKKQIALTTAIALTMSANFLPSLALAHGTENHAQHFVTTSTPASDFRTTFDQLLNEHAWVALLVMQKGIDGATDFSDVAALLQKNTDDLSAAISSVYGQDAGTAFKKMWSEHIGFFVDYVKATANKDESGRQQALSHLKEYGKEFSAFLATANPNLKADMLEAGLQMHVDQLIGAFDSYVNKDYKTTYQNWGTAFTHMIGTGDALSGAIVTQFPERFSDTNPVTPAANLRITLDRLLAEHAELAIIVMQKGYDGSPDFAQAAGLLQQNTDALSSAIASVYGKDAGAAFKKMWEEHIGFFVDYVKATAAKDEMGRQVAKQHLAEYGKEFAAFLASANPNLDSSELRKGLAMHVQQLIQSFDSYVNKQYGSAYMSAEEAYQHMFATGDMLSSAIVTQFPEQFASIVTHLQIGSKTLEVNQDQLPMDVAPFIMNDRTFVSLRFLSEAVGAKVAWNQDTQTVTVTAGKNTALFWIGKDYMDFNGKRMNIGQTVFLKDNRTQIPVRFIAQTLGWDVYWNQNTKVVTLLK